MDRMVMHSGKALLCLIGKRRRLFSTSTLLLHTFLLCFAAIATAETAFNEKDVTLHVKDTAFTGGVTCLSSAEYDQLYLPPEVQCPGCKMDDASIELLRAGWRSDAVLLVARQANELNISEVKLSSSSATEFYTSYRDAAFFPERLNGMSQCTSELPAVASCAEKNGKCLLLFGRTITKGASND